MIIENLSQTLAVFRVGWPSRLSSCQRNKNNTCTKMFSALHWYNSGKNLTCLINNLRLYWLRNEPWQKRQPCVPTKPPLITLTAPSLRLIIYSYPCDLPTRVLFITKIALRRFLSVNYQKNWVTWRIVTTYWVKELF